MVVLGKSEVKIEVAAVTKLKTGLPGEDRSVRACHTRSRK